MVTAWPSRSTPSTAWVASAWVPPPAPTRRVTEVLKNPFLPPRVPSGDSCQEQGGGCMPGPQPSLDPKACQLTQSRSKTSAHRVPRPHVGQQTGREGWPG